MNSVHIVGKLGKDAETRYTGSGTPVSTLNVATERRTKKGEERITETEWVTAVLWQKEGLLPYLTKGSTVAIRGRLQTRSWETDGQKRYATEVVVEDIELHGGNAKSQDSGQSRTARPAQRRAPAKQDQYDGMGVGSDDEPF